MKLYLLRHGLADWPDWTGSDDERPLTKKGRKEARKVAKFLRNLKIAPVILTSPLPRAQQTAAIAAHILEVEMREEKTLRPGFAASDLARLAKKFHDKSLMLVGHEPDFTRAIFRLTGAKTKLPKTGVALVDLDVAAMTGELLWLLPPKITLA